MGLGASMSIILSTPKVDELSSAADALKRWQLDEGALQLHSGDLGWHSQNGAVTLAAAATLRDLGASSAGVCVQSSNAGAVATYASAGFTPSAEVTDLRRGPR